MYFIQLSLCFAGVRFASNMSGEANLSIIIVSVVNFGLGRLIGVVPLSFVRQTFTVTKSKFWQFTSVLFGGTFIVCYPIALRDIFAERSVQTTGIWLITEIVQYTTTYMLTAWIYILNVFYSDDVIDYINDGFHYCFVYEKRLEPTADERNSLLFQFVFRSIYSYLGFIYSNYIRLGYIYGRAPEIRTMVYYLPDIVITSAAIRFMSTIIMQLSYYRRLNEIARTNMEMANATAKMMRYEREKICGEISEQIDWLCDHQSRLRAIARASERLLSKNCDLFDGLCVRQFGELCK